MWNKILVFLHIKKKKQAEVASTNGLLTAEPEVRPVYEEGYCEDKDTIIRLVSTKKKKDQKAYQITGIDDVASSNNWKGWLYLAPVIILISVFLLYPLVNTIFIAFAKDYEYATGHFSGITLRNFGEIFGIVSAGKGGKEVFFTKYAIPNTLIITFITVPVSIVLALIISVALNSIKWFQKTLQTVFFLPYVTNAMAVGLVFSVLFDKDGVINFIFGINKTWIYGADRWDAMVPLCLFIVWNSIPFKILIFLSGLQGIDKQYYQAAQIDSCPKWKVLTRITIPLLSPQILYIMITSFIGSFKEYTSVVSIFNGPGTYASASSNDPNMETIVYYVYDNVEAGFTSRAAAAGVFLFVIVLLFTFVQMKVSKSRVHY